MDCSRFEEIVFLYCDNQLDEEQIVLYRSHIEACPVCAQRAVYTEKLLTIVRRRCGRAETPAGLRARIRARLRAEAMEP